MNGLYTLGSDPTVFGIFAFIVIGFITIMGFSNKNTIPRIGRTRWKQIHLVLSIVVLLIVLYHSLKFGGDFAFLGL
jgi:DMSO/TMAO reductase YedYZ heme-binding membrane subunit